MQDVTYLLQTSHVYHEMTKNTTLQQLVTQDCEDSETDLAIRQLKK